jgi:hypothetical protein
MRTEKFSTFKIVQLLQTYKFDVITEQMIFAMLCKLVESTNQFSIEKKFRLEAIQQTFFMDLMAAEKQTGIHSDLLESFFGLIIQEGQNQGDPAATFRQATGMQFNITFGANGYIEIQRIKP